MEKAIVNSSILKPPELQQFYAAAKANNVDEVRAAIRKLRGYVDKQRPEYDGITPLQKALHIAVCENKNDSYIKTIETLLNNGKAKNSVEKNDPLLHRMIDKADVKTIELFLDSGIDVHVKDNNGENSLFRSIRTKNKEIVNLLLDHGLDVNSVNKDISTPLHLATKLFDQSEHELSLIEMLLKNGANINSQDEDGKTALHYSIHMDKVKIVELLLNYKADINVKDFKGKIPLFSAARNSNPEIVQLLVDFGSDINIINENNETFLHLATNSVNCNYVQSTDYFDCYFQIIYEENHYNTVEVALKSGANVDAQNKYGRTVLHNLVCGNSVEIVELFLSFESDVNIKDIYGAIPLFNAVKNKIKILQLLLDYGTDVNCTDNNGRTSFHYLADNYGDKFFCIDSSKIFIRHIAKLQAFNLFIHRSILDAISERTIFRDYLANCLEELTAAKSTRLQNSWITLFNILTDDKRKLKNYAGNASLIKEFQKIDCVENYPIYGPSMQENVEKGIRRRELFDQSSIMLSDCLPIFNPNNLIIRDILDCLVASKDLSKFCT